MANDYEILRKANLADDLFRADDDDAAWQQEEAERAWALDADAPSEAEPPRTEQAPPPPAATAPVSRAGQPEQVQLQPILRAPGARRWAQALADLAGNPALESVRTLGVCAVEQKSGATAATTALAHWMSQFVDRPALAIEGHFRQPGLALALEAPNVGIHDVLIRMDALESSVQDTGNAKVKLLPGGAPFRDGDRDRAMAELPRMVASLRERFDSILVELPAVDDPNFRKLPIAELVDAVILVVDSKSAQHRAIRNASDKLRQARVPVAASILQSIQTVSPQARRGPR